MKFLILAALVAVAVAETSYPYQAPAYKTAYPAPAYKSYDHEYPAQPYSFNWAVKDDYYNDYGHSESGDGKYVNGQYHVLLPDGRTQTVTYKVDGYSGYVADVKYSGDYKSYDYKPSYKPASYAAPTYPAPTYPAPTYPAPTYPAPAYPAKY